MAIGYIHIGTMAGTLKLERTRAGGTMSKDRGDRH
jgi:hypothetical protein